MREQLKSDFEDFVAMHGEGPLLRLLEINSPPTEEVFLKRLYQELQEIIVEIETGRKQRHEDEEDRLSVELVSNFKSSGYFSKHDPNNGGHVDILVETKGDKKFKWYAEAKIWNGVVYLHGGMEQLLNRYSSGREKNLGFLVYFKTDNIVSKMVDWKNHLNDQQSVDKSLTLDVDEFSFFTTHKHTAGTSIQVKHCSLNINWDTTKNVV